MAPTLREYKVKGEEHEAIWRDADGGRDVTEEVTRRIDNVHGSVAVEIDSALVRTEWGHLVSHRIREVDELHLGVLWELLKQAIRVLWVCVFEDDLALCTNNNLGVYKRGRVSDMVPVKVASSPQPSAQQVSSNHLCHGPHLYIIFLISVGSILPFLKTSTTPSEQNSAARQESSTGCSPGGQPLAC